MFGRRLQADTPVAKSEETSESPDHSDDAVANAKLAGHSKQTRQSNGADSALARSKRAAAAKVVFERIQTELLERIDASAAAKLPRDELQRQIAELIGEIVAEEKLPVTIKEQQELTITLVDDMVGLGPLEPLLADEGVN